MTYTQCLHELKRLATQVYDTIGLFRLRYRRCYVESEPCWSARAEDDGGETMFFCQTNTYKQLVATIDAELAQESERWKESDSVIAAMLKGENK